MAQEGCSFQGVNMTKEDLLMALQAAVGDTPYGRKLVSEADETWGAAEKKYGWNMKDRLDDKIGVLKAYQKIHAAAGKESLAEAEGERIAVCEKALEAIRGFYE